MKLEHALKMLLRLSFGQPVKKKELEDYLQLSNKAIQRLRAALEEAGYLIEYIPGRYGGYRLISTHQIKQLPLKLTKEDKLALHQGYQALRNYPKSILADKFHFAFEKIISQFQITSENYSQHFIRLQALEKETIQQDLAFLQAAITNHYRLVLTYQKLDHTINNYFFEPYQLFTLDQSWYIFGLIKVKNDQTYQSVRTFKLYRIQAVRHLMKADGSIETFIPDESVTLQQAIRNNQDFAIDPITLQAIITDHNYLMEYQLGEQQKIEIIDNRSFALTVTFASSHRAINFINSLGADIYIKSPQALQQHQINEANKILKVYSKTS